MVSPPQRHPDYLSTAQFSFVDAHGRQIHLRGVNLSGACKAPLDQPSHILKDFWETAEAGGESFIGQPLNLDDGSADEHLARLRGWGFNLLRFPVTWEALEHTGPKKYDYDFMDYTIRVLLKCKQYGFRVYMDPHQDTWSRFSGGSGAPFWTLPACGINPYNLSSTHSALIHSEWPLPHQPDPASFPAMIWGTNYGRLLSLTLFTLFFAGRAFAPKCIIDNMNIQDYLQSHYIAAFGELADRIRRADEEEGAGLRDACIIGWDSLNEPAEGLVEWDDLNINPTQQGNTLKKGTHPTPAQSLCLGMGKTQTVECWDFGTFGPKRTGKVTIDPKGRKIWAEPDTTTGNPEGGGERPDGVHPRWGWKRDVSRWPLGTCIWALHGVWDVESGFVLRPDYFKYHPATGIEVQFMTDFWLPHFKDYTTRIRQSHPEAILLIQPPVFAMPPRVDEEVLKGRCAYTGHYYDGLTLITKHWNWFNADSLGVLRGRYKSPLQAVKFGEGAIRKSLMEQIGVLKDDAKLISAPSQPSSSEELSPVSRRTRQGRQPNEYPTIIGEIGTPFDMDKKYSYFSSKGDYKNQEKALDASLNACDGYNNVAYTVWTYVPRGHTHEWGDAWNGEDLSLWSPDDLRSTYTPKQGGGNGEQGCCGVGLKNRRSRRRKTSGGESTPPQGKNESQAELLGPSLARSNNKNPSTLTVTSLDTPASGSLETSPTIPSASTPTLLLRKRPSLAFSARTIVEDDRLAAPPQPVQASSSSSSTLTTSGGGPDEDPYDFLTDGARAVRAFCRPRPMKVIGNVVDTKFDISKAEFKCVIRVPPLSSRPQQEEREDKEEAATEIYLPMVHFASRELLEGSKARWDPSASQRLKLGLEPSASKVYAAALPQVAGWKDLDDDAPVGSTNAPCESTLLDNIEDRDDLLDVDVKVSGGHWKISGQTLYWWYPSPSSEGEEVEFTVEVKRRGGAIKVKKGGWVEVKSWQKSQQRFDGDGTVGKKKWYERLCPCDGSMCVIM